jgi:hypothetical protein
MDSSFWRGCAGIYDIFRDEGVEVRMPFYDRRLVEFSMSRPPGELNQPQDFKVLLQQAMAGKLPERTREPEAGGLKTGTAAGYIASRYPREARDLMARLSKRRWISGEIGVVDRSRFAGAFEGELAGGMWGRRVDLSAMLFAEVWLETMNPGH